MLRYTELCKGRVEKYIYHNNMNLLAPIIILQVICDKDII